MNGDSLPGRRAQLLILLVVCCLVLTVLGLPLRVAESQVINTGPLFISSNEIVTIDDDFIQADRTQQTTNQGAFEHILTAPFEKLPPTEILSWAYEGETKGMNVGMGDTYVIEVQYPKQKNFRGQEEAAISESSLTITHMPHSPTNSIDPSR